MCSRRQWSLAAVGGEQPIVLATARVVWGSNNSIKCNPVLVLEASLGYKRWPAGALFPPPTPNCLEISFVLPSYAYMSLKASTAYSFRTTLQMALNFSCFSLCSLPHPLLPSSSLLEPPVPAPPPPWPSITMFPFPVPLSPLLYTSPLRFCGFIPAFLGYFYMRT